MGAILQYKCPACGGAIEFDSALQKMKCPFCDTEFEVSDLQSFDDALKSQEQSADNMVWETQGGGEWQEGEENEMSVYVCQSCGGEVVCDQNTTATTCPYCDNVVVMTGKLSGTLKPDLVIPFKLDKAAAKQGLMNHIKGKRLLPKVFRDENHIDEIKGVYVPFWLFNTHANAHIRYKATKTRSWSDSNYNYTETSHYSLIRSGFLSFGNVPVDGSSKIDNTLAESIEPYNFSEAVDFQTAYLAGYLADKYDVDAQQSIARANERIRNSTESAFASTASGYNSVTAEQSNIQLYDGKASYALLPVWLLNTTWKGQKYIFAMNGQTGKFIGDLPLDKSAYRKWLFGLTGIIGAAAMLISYLLWLF